MTTYNKATLKTFFETGDVPVGQDFANFIDSYVNIVETVPQSLAGPLSATELNSALVSAANGNFTTSLKLPPIVSAGIVYADNVISSAHTTGLLFSDNITTSAMRFGFGVVSAAGTAQATATQLLYTINIGTGVVDGQTTGFRLQGNQQGRIQYFVNGAVSANLWPVTGGQINALASNAAYPLAANTPYTIIHTQSSGAAVK